MSSRYSASYSNDLIKDRASGYIEAVLESNEYEYPDNEDISGDRWRHWCDLVQHAYWKIDKYHSSIESKSLLDDNGDHPVLVVYEIPEGYYPDIIRKSLFWIRTYPGFYGFIVETYTSMKEAISSMKELQKIWKVINIYDPYLNESLNPADYFNKPLDYDAETLDMQPTYVMRHDLTYEEGRVAPQIIAAPPLDHRYTYSED
jgi:hypothetical protein